MALTPKNTMQRHDEHDDAALHQAPDQEDGHRANALVPPGTENGRPARPGRAGEFRQFDDVHHAGGHGVLVGARRCRMPLRRGPGVDLVVQRDDRPSPMAISVALASRSCRLASSTVGQRLLDQLVDLGVGVAAAVGGAEAAILVAVWPAATSAARTASPVPEPQPTRMKENSGVLVRAAARRARRSRSMPIGMVSTIGLDADAGQHLGHNASAILASLM